MAESVELPIAIQDVDLPADVDRLMELERELFDAEAYTASDFWNCAAQGCVLRKAVSGSLIIGDTIAQSTAGPQGLTYYVWNLCVSREMQRQGVGQGLFDDMLNAATGLGCAAMRLEVMDTNEAAIRFYKRNGFTQSDVNPHYYPKGEDALVMERPL